MKATRELTFGEHVSLLILGAAAEAAWRAHRGSTEGLIRRARDGAAELLAGRAFIELCDAMNKIDLPEL